MILIPGVFIYMMYSLIGGMIKSDMEKVGDYSVAVVDTQGDLTFLQEIFPVNQKVAAKDLKTEYDLIREGKRDLLISIPDHFTEMAKSGMMPDIEVYYNSGKTSSQQAYALFEKHMDTYRNMHFKTFSINRSNKNYDLMTKDDVQDEMISKFVPLLLLVTLISSCMSIGSEVIAGEKERGTLYALLLTPVSRFDIALSKVVALSIMGLIAGISTFLGLLFSIPVLSGLSGTNAVISSYSYQEYAAMVLVIFSIVLFVMSFVGVISAWAKGTREANLLGMPLSMAGVAVSFFASNTTESAVAEFIPLLNSVRCLTAVLRDHTVSGNLLKVLVSNGIGAIILIVVLGIMLMSERIIYSR